MVRTGRLAFGIIGVCREPKANASGIALLRGREILCQPRKSAHQQRQNTGGHWVQRSQMADGLLTCDAAQPVDHVVAGDTAWLIDHKKPVHIITLASIGWLANPAGNAPS